MCPTCKGVGKNPCFNCKVRGSLGRVNGEKIGSVGWARRLGVLRGVARRRTGTEGALFLQGTRALSTLPAISRDLRRTHARHLYFI